MAIKYGRPIDAKTRLVPVEAKAPVKTAARLDLAVRPRRNRKADWARAQIHPLAAPAPDLLARRHFARGRDRPCRSGR